jgi:hypothetical protein
VLLFIGFSLMALTLCRFHQDTDTKARQEWKA